jgi:putative transposon-encoded protein
MDKEKNRRYHREYYHKNPEYRKKVIERSSMNKKLGRIEELKNVIQIREVKKIGNSCHVTLPVDWKGKEVVVIDNKHFKVKL